MWLSDEEYLFRQDIAEKKKTATGAYHKKSGAKSKKCNFPSDYLTKKEKMKMNSEVKSWNLNDFYTWNDFKQMPHDLQVMYLQGITDKYKVGTGAIEESLFQIGRTTLSSYLQKHHLADKIHWHVFKGAKAHVYNAEFERTIDKYRLAIVDTLAPVEEIEGTPAEETTRTEEVSIVKYVSQPEVPVIDTDIFKSSPRNCIMESDGFDIELFRYLAKRYKDMDCAIEIRVIVKG